MNEALIDDDEYIVAIIWKFLTIRVYSIVTIESMCIEIYNVPTLV